MVKFNKILSLLSVASLGLVAAKPMKRATTEFTGICQELSDFLYEKNADLYACGMTENEDDITYLGINSRALNQDMIDKFATYSALNEISIDDVYTVQKGLDLSSLNISNLILDNNYIETTVNTSIPRGVLKTAVNINKLSIFRYDIAQKNINEISTLTQLTTLDFDGCTFDKDIDYHKLKYLKNLNELYFDTIFISGGKGCMKELPEDICQLKKLKTLSLYRNDLTTLPSCISNLKYLEKLNMEMNDLTVLPPEIGALTRLKELNLNENELSSLPAEIGNLAKLKELYLEGNKISTLPDEFGQLTSLKELDLSYNKIGSIPEGLVQLPALEKLDLTHNKVYRIPSSMLSLTHLKELYLGSNKIKEIPEKIYKLWRLETIGLSSNLLTSLPESLSKLKNLTYLNVVENDIDPETVPEALKNLPNLEIIFSYDDLIKRTI